MIWICSQLMGEMCVQISSWMSPRAMPADYEDPRLATGIQPLAIERCSDLTEPLCAQLAPIGKLVASIPAPGGDHRQHEDPALAQQVVIDPRIVRADRFRGMGEVEFDRPTATRLEID